MSESLGRVSVILPTYNGEKYLKKTVESVLNQTYDDIVIYIRDDGSSDGTVDVINRLCRDNDGSKKIQVLRDDLGNLGCPDSFYQIVRSIEHTEFYAFCDQDDYWEPNKIECAVSMLASSDKNVPNVYFSSFAYTTESGELIRYAPKQSHTISVEKTLFYTPGLGFTIVFDDSARRSFIDDVDCGTLMHDRWILRCGAAMGNVVYDKRPLARHIRHSDAVTSADRRKIDLLRFYLKTELSGDDARETERKIKHFLDVFESRLSANDRSTLALFSNSDAALPSRFKKLFYPRRLRPTMGGELAIRLLFLMGRA